MPRRGGNLDKVGTVVVGAGVVGLAVGRALAARGREVLILESESLIGSGISSRNSEVIHAGIYYPTGSLKARLCVAGKQALYDHCVSRGVEHRRCGKLIVASEEGDLPVLETLMAKARENGVDDLVWLDRGQVAEREPDVACIAALLSSSTGIVDSHGLMLSLLGEAESKGAMLAFGTPVTGGARESDGIVLEVGGAVPMRLKARELVNAAGLGAQAVARSIDGFPATCVPALHYAKGNYYVLGRRSPFSSLIYPVPEPGGLGVHATIDLAGRCRFGPDVEWVEELDYTVDPARAEAFYAAVRRYWPGLQDGALQPAYSGIRPKLHPRGAAADDFVIQGPAEHGVPGMVNLFGIESPGLTSCLAIADEVAALLAD